jgi:hypothetical protein
MVDNFKGFFEDTKSNIIILISATLSIVFYVTLKATDMSNKTGIMSLRILSLISAIIFILSIVRKFIPSMSTNTNYIAQLIFFLSKVFEYLKSSITNIFIFLKTFFMNLPSVIMEIFRSIVNVNPYVILFGIIGLGIVATIGYLLYLYRADINIEKIKQYAGAKKIIYSILTFLLILSVLYNLIPKLYSSNETGSYKGALIVGIIVFIAMLLAGFFINEIFAGDYRNYGSIMFNVLIFVAFVYIIYGMKKMFFDPKQPTLESYTTFEYFLYYYLFPICFFIGYILYYFYIYKKENLSYTDFSDYRIIIFNILTFFIVSYLFYQLIIKNLLTFSTDSPIVNFFKSVLNVIPCIFGVLLEYFIKNPIFFIFSIGISALFIFLLTLITGNVRYNSWYMILIYIIGIIIFISGILKLLLDNTNLGDSKVFQLFKHTIFTLPCLFLLGIDKAFIGKKFGTIPEFLFIILIVFFIFFYNAITTAIIPDLYEKYILNNGKQLINNPLSLSKYTFISSYEDLFDLAYDKSNFDYRYGLSFWVYLNSFAPINTQLYDICSLGDGLMVKYNSVENTMYFMYKVKSEKLNNNVSVTLVENFTVNELERWNKYKKRQKKMDKFLNDNKIEEFQSSIEEEKKEKEMSVNEIGSESEFEEIIIHKENGILLQKWNNIIINYYGGTLDIFINGKIIKSKINVVPYITNTALTVGENDGISGDICNLIYYKSPMTKSDIYRMYNIFKSKNPPVINKSDTNVMNFSETLEVYFSELLTKTTPTTKNKKD